MSAGRPWPGPGPRALRAGRHPAQAGRSASAAACPERGSGPGTARRIGRGRTPPCRRRGIRGSTSPSPSTGSRALSPAGSGARLLRR